MDSRWEAPRTGGYRGSGTRPNPMPDPPRGPSGVSRTKEAKMDSADLDEVIDMAYAVARFELRRAGDTCPTIRDAIYAGIVAAIAVQAEIERLKKSGT